MNKYFVKNSENKSDSDSQTVFVIEY